VLVGDVGNQALEERAVEVIAAEDAAALLADAALEQVEEDAAGVAVRLDFGFPKELGSAAHVGMINAAPGSLVEWRPAANRMAMLNAMREVRERHQVNTPWPVASGSRFPQLQRGIAILALMAAAIPGVGLLASGFLRSELRDEAPRMIILLSIPIACALPSVFARASIRTASAVAGGVVLAAFCVYGAMSIGILYLPAAALLLLAGVMGGSRRRGPTRTRSWCR
jgi:hypothetical protein